MNIIHLIRVQTNEQISKYIVGGLGVGIAFSESHREGQADFILFFEQAKRNWHRIFQIHPFPDSKNKLLCFRVEKLVETRKLKAKNQQF